MASLEDFYLRYCAQKLLDGEVEKVYIPKGNSALELTYKGSFI